MHLAIKLFLLGSCGGAALSQSSGIFSAGGRMSQERTWHTATLLNDGKVLIAGGSSYPALIARASAELYDPATDQFSLTGNMSTARYLHTATLLPDGRVLIAGGNSTIDGGCFCDPVASAEIYDPATGAFTAISNMTTARSGHTATLLKQGQVLLTGGPVNGGTATAELYDPATGSFTSTGLMTAPRANHTATLLASGKVLVAGGAGEDERLTSELFDPDTGTFSASGAAVHTPREAGAATLLESGTVLFTLKNSEDSEPGAEIYDPESGTFQLTSNMQAGRGYSTGTQLPDGRILVAGRDQKGGSAEIYNPQTATFSDLMRLQREEGYTATLLKDGTVLMAGGWVCCGNSIATSEIYRPARLIPSPLLHATSHATTHEPVSPIDPAVAGEALELYLTGLSAGSVIPPQVAIGGKMAEVLFFGNAPGFPAGNQVNVRVPEGVAPGPTVPLRLMYLGRPANESRVALR